MKTRPTSSLKARSTSEIFSNRAFIRNTVVAFVMILLYVLGKHYHTSHRPLEGTTVSYQKNR